MQFSALEHVNLPIRLHIVSKTPGRIRLRVAPEYRQDHLMNEIKQLLTTLSGEVTQVRTNAQTGSIVIYFTGEISQFENIFSTLSQSGMILNDIPVEVTTATSKVTQTISRFNQRINLATEGSVDLRFLFPLILALLALRQLFSKSPRLNTAPWYILAWYAFDSFIKLNSSNESQKVTKTTHSTEDRVDDYLAHESNDLHRPVDKSTVNN